MGLLGLRKFIDASGCTRVLPSPACGGDDEKEGMCCGLGACKKTGEYGSSAESLLTSSFHMTDNGEKDEAGSGEVGSRGVPFSAPSSSSLQGSGIPLADHVLVDMNCIVHSCIGRQNMSSTPKKQLIQDVLERLRVLLTVVVVPRKSLTFCLDGPAPIAKLQTQRLRRRKVSLMDTGGVEQLNSLSITAGSLFMIELENAIASQFKLNDGKGFLRRHCAVYLYGSTVVGEGEAKISRALTYLAFGAVPQHSVNEEEMALVSSLSHHGSKQRKMHHGSPRGGRNSGGHQGHSRRLSGYAMTSRDSTNRSGANPIAINNTASPRYNPNDTVVVVGNDIDLVMTCLAATSYHNLSIIGPSSLQLIDVSEILYRWLHATSTMRSDSGFQPAQLPSIRLDFIFLFLLNGGDHYVGAGEVALILWKRYRTVRAVYPNSSLISPDLDCIDIDFLADLVQASEYTGSASVEVGMDLLQSALWSLYTVVTGVCPDYAYVPPPSAPQLCHIRAAAAHCQRTRQSISLQYVANSLPLTPLETYVALMPTEATLPRSVTAALRGNGQGERGSTTTASTSKHHRQTLLKVLEGGNDPKEIAKAAREAVEVAGGSLTTSEQYLRSFTSPVQLNAQPPKRRLSRHEQHGLLKKNGYIHIENPLPVVQPIELPEEVPSLYSTPASGVSCWNFYCPFTKSKGTYGRSADDCREVSGRGSDILSTREVRTRPPTLEDTTAISMASQAQPQRSRARGGAPLHRRVLLNDCEGENARAARSQERNSAKSKLQRALSLAESITANGQHFTAAQRRRMQRRLHRLKQQDTAEQKKVMASEDDAYNAADHQRDEDFEAELRAFLQDDASPEMMRSLMQSSSSMTKAATGEKTEANGIRQATPFVREEQKEQSRTKRSRSSGASPETVAHKKGRQEVPLASKVVLRPKKKASRTK